MRLRSCRCVADFGVEQRAEVLSRLHGARVNMRRSTDRKAFQPSQNHWTFKVGLFKEHVTREQLRIVLLNHADPIIKGRACEWKTKHLGAGIYALWAEEKP